MLCLGSGCGLGRDRRFLGAPHWFGHLQQRFITTMVSTGYNRCQRVLCSLTKDRRDAETLNSKRVNMEDYSRDTGAAVQTHASF